MGLLNTLALLFGLSAMAACGNRPGLQCEQNSNCDLAGGGMCSDPGTGNRWCAYPDGACPSGYRYSNVQVGDGVSGTCVRGVDAGVEADASAPIQDWISHYGGSNSELAQHVAVTVNGDIVTTGRFSGTTNQGGTDLVSNGTSDFWVARYRADGTFLWSKSFGGTDIDFATSVGVDVAGDVYLGGQFGASVDFGGGVRTVSGTGGFILKLNGTNGAYVWDRTLGLSIPSHAGNIAVASLDASTIIAGGFFIGTVDFGNGPLSSQSPDGSDSWVAAYDSATSKPKWIKQISATSNAGDFGGLAVASGDVFIAGGFNGMVNLGGNALNSVGSEDLFVGRYRGSDGAHVWSIRDGGANGESVSGGIAVAGSRVVVSGYFVTSTTVALKAFTSAGSLDGFVAGYSIADGSPVWATQLGGAAPDKNIAIAANADRLAVALNFTGTVTITGQTLNATGGASSNDLALVRLSPDSGSPLLVAQFFDGETVSLYYASDRLVGMGSFLGSVTFFGKQLTSQGMDDIVLFRVGF